MGRIYVVSFAKDSDIRLFTINVYPYLLSFKFRSLNNRDKTQFLTTYLL